MRQRQEAPPPAAISGFPTDLIAPLIDAGRESGQLPAIG
jgi:hypothetical protein